MKHSLIAFFFLALLANNAFALGLGKTELHSTLGQPLKATITVVGAEDYDDEQLLVSLADKSVFARMGIGFNLNHLRIKMKTALTQDKQRIILLSTNQPVNEPYLEFIIVLKSPEGQNLKTVALLLDAPEKSEEKPDFRIEAQ